MGDAALGIEVIVGRDGGLAKATESDEDCWDIHNLDEVI